jgi:hypothetical protein
VRTAALTLLSLLASVLLFGLIDLGLSQVSWFGLIRNPGLRVAHPVYHHSLGANICTWDRWGPRRLRMCTNALAFRDAAIRQVPLAGDKPRVLFIGDSFTEGVGTAWEDSFVGRYAAAHPEIEVLNAGVGSYAPAIYYAKVRDLLEKGLHFDHLVVFIDISDIQDQVWYRVDAEGRVIDIRDDALAAWERRLESFGMRNNWALVDIHQFVDTLHSRPEEDSARFPDAFSSYKSAWTWEDWDTLAPYYQPDGVKAAVDRSLADMDRLYELLQQRGVAISVGVYPWPGQMKFDSVDSRQVRLWRDWCQGKCFRFIDAFPDFFAYRDAHPETWYQDLFIAGDIHYNERGNALLADRLLDSFRLAETARLAP